MQEKLFKPHLQQALDSPTTTSRPFLSTVRNASSTSSEMRARAGLLNTPPSCSPCASDGRFESDACWEDVAAPAYSTEERFHREPPQVKMTARMNSRPHNFTPYEGPSSAFTPASSRHTASAVVFHIMLREDIH